jgi:sterol 3beta-glucosyltransferase
LGNTTSTSLTLLSLGSRGDVQPFVALGLALQESGYHINIATHGIFEDFVRSRGLEFRPVKGNPQEIVQGDTGRTWLESESKPFQFARGFRSLMGPVLHQAMQDGLLACQDADALIFGGPAYYIGYSIAKKLDIPYIQAYLQPVHPTTEFPSALFPARIPENGLFNYLSHLLGGGLFWQLLRPVVNEARREFLDLPPISFMGPFPEMMREEALVLYGYCPSVIPKPSNWGDWIHVTGYWFLEQDTWSPAPELVEFIRSGPPPVYVGFGSMTDRDPERITGIVLEALQESRQPGILLTGWGGLTQNALPENVFKLDNAPHDWLFPRMKALVHHGGAGTTAAGLAAGKPTVIVPFFGDQTFWGRRVFDLGAGPHPIERSKLSASALAAAIRQAAESPSMQTRAASLGENIRAEQGLEEALRCINHLLQQ